MNNECPVKLTKKKLALVTILLSKVHSKIKKPPPVALGW
jgi:hypothetical protein